MSVRQEVARHVGAYDAVSLLCVCEDSLEERSLRPFRSGETARSIPGDCVPHATCGSLDLIKWLGDVCAMRHSQERTSCMTERWPTFDSASHPDQVVTDRSSRTPFRSKKLLRGQLNRRALFPSPSDRACTRDVGPIYACHGILSMWQSGPIARSMRWFASDPAGRATVDFLRY